MQWLLDPMSPSVRQGASVATRREALFGLVALIVAGPVRAAEAESAAPPLTLIEGFRAAEHVFSISAGFAGSSASRQTLAIVSTSAAQMIAAYLEVYRTAIAAAQKTAMDLPEGERVFLTTYFDPDVLGPVLGAVERCRQALLGGSSANGYQVALNDIMDQRSALMQRPQGRGPEAAALLPLILAAELSMARRAPPTQDAIPELLDIYEQWMRSMRTGGNGAIPFRRTMAEAAHDGQLGEVAKSHLGRRLNVQSLLFANDQKGGKTADPCVLISKNVMNWSHDSRGAIQPTSAQSIMAWGTLGVPNVVYGRSDISVYRNDQFGVLLIRFRPAQNLVNVKAPRVGSWAGGVGETCYIGRSEVVLDDARAMAVAGDIPGAKEDNKVRAEMVSAINSANAARLQIALCGMGLMLLEEVEDMIDYHRRNPTS